MTVLGTTESEHVIVHSSSVVGCSSKWVSLGRVVWLFRDLLAPFSRLYLEQVLCDVLCLTEMLATSQIHAVPLRRTSSVAAGPGNDDGELTSLSWLHKPGVLNSMCNALTGSPHRISTLGTRSLRKPRDQRGGDRATDGEQADDLRPRRGSCNTTEKMLNVVLSVVTVVTMARTLTNPRCPSRVWWR